MISAIVLYTYSVVIVLAVKSKMRIYVFKQSIKKTFSIFNFHFFGLNAKSYFSRKRQVGKWVIVLIIK